MQQVAPARFGSVRQTAWRLPFVSRRAASQPRGYSATTRRIFPRRPFRTRCRASRTMGSAVSVCVRQNSRPVAPSLRSRLVASSSVRVIGRSQST